MWLIGVLYIVCASTFTISKAALSYAAPVFFIGVRMLTAGTILLAYDYMFNNQPLRIAKKHYGLFAQIIIFYIYGAYVLDIIALQDLTSSKSCLLYSLVPFLTALFSYFWFHEVMTPYKWFGLLLGFAGFLPIIVAPSAESTIGGSFISWAEVVMFGAIVCASYGWILIRQLVREHDYSVALINGVGMAGGGLLALLTSHIFEQGRGKPLVYDLYPFIFYMTLIIIASNFIFSTLHTFLLKRYTATFLSFAGFTTPLFAALLGWFFLNEKITWEFFTTTGAVFLGLYIFYKEELKQGYHLPRGSKR